MTVQSLAVLALLACASVAAAQPNTQAEERSRVRLGPVGLSPSIGLTNFGVDTNVFNEVRDPKRDFTTTVTPSLAASIHAGRARLSAKTRVDLVYFARYAGERSANTRQTVKLDAGLHRFRPYISTDIISARERPGFEIDARSKRREYRFAGGTELRLGMNTSATFEALQRTIEFDAAEIFDGSYLFQTLNRAESTVSVGLKRRVTPLTTVTLAVEAERTRFTHTPERDTNAFRLVPRVDLAPSALVNGSVAIGFRRSQPLASDTPEFNGLVGAADVAYTLFGTTRVSFALTRDIDYSYDRTWPYYVSTGVATVIRQRVAGPWDVHLTAGRRQLQYMPSHTSGAATRLDYVVRLGGGTSYRLGPTTRLMFNLEQIQRDSEIPMRAYSGLQSGLTVAYDF